MDEISEAPNDQKTLKGNEKDERNINLIICNCQRIASDLLAYFLVSGNHFHEDYRSLTLIIEMDMQWMKKIKPLLI